MQQICMTSATNCCTGGWFMVHDTTLVLADGSCFTGSGFGRKAPRIDELDAMGLEAAPLGEVVFNTTMGAYHEIITDPSYAGQTIVMTSAHIGNYGCDLQWNETLMEKPPCKALVLRDLYDGPLPPGRTSLAQICETWDICGMTGVDTRALTIHLRTCGSSYGVPVAGTDLDDAQIARVVAWLNACPTMSERDFIGSCTVARPVAYHTTHPSKGTWALWDFGIKRSIVHQLLEHGIDVTVFPATMNLDEILVEGHRFDALFLSNGPGDPALLGTHVAQLAARLGTIPIVGICLGHQLAALALGAQTRKMLFGHHGPNHPVRDLLTGNVYVTAQNHGYCVDADTFGSSTSLWLVNDNDRTVEGMYDNDKRVMTVQFHPEAGPGPWEARALFGVFMRFVDGLRFGDDTEGTNHAS